MKNGQPETTADCLRELARVIDSSRSKVDWKKCIRYLGVPYNHICIPEFTNPNNWTFARAIVESKPVFVGDELYDRNGDKFKSEFHHPIGDRAVLALMTGWCEGNNLVRFADQCTWERKPLCMVEGKPVYKGDKLYDCHLGCKVPVIAVRMNGEYLVSEKHTYDPKLLSWNEPKQKTVMFNGEELPMPVEDSDVMVCFCVSSAEEAHKWLGAIRKITHD